jgi:hypothetical protein
MNEHAEIVMLRLLLASAEERAQTWETCCEATESRLRACEAERDDLYLRLQDDPYTLS